MKRKKVLYINVLRQYRKLMKYSQEDVAFILGVKKIGTISKWEKGLSQPTLPYMFKLSILYSTLPEVLFLDMVIVLRREVSAGVKKRKIKKAKSIR